MPALTARGVRMARTGSGQRCARGIDHLALLDQAPRHRFAAPSGTTIRSIAGGKVTWAGWKDNSGEYVAVIRLINPLKLSSLTRRSGATHVPLSYGSHRG